MHAAGDGGGGGLPWLKRRLKKFAGTALRQVPCLHAVKTSLRCLKRGRYESLGEDEDGEGVAAQDQRQNLNRTVGQVLVKVALVLLVLVTVLVMYRSKNDTLDPYQIPETLEERTAAFRRDSPLVLYIAAIEILICGACAHTASEMYERRRHSVRHPADAPEKERNMYTKVQLEKEAGKEASQLYGLGFRPSTDGLECLVVEAIRPCSLLDLWINKQANPTAEVLLEEALGDAQPEGSGGSAAAAADGASGAGDRQGDDPERLRRAAEEVRPGAAVVAVNDVSADVGMMQLQLTKPKVTMWVRSYYTHPSEFESELLAAQQAVPGHEGLGAAAAAQGPAPGSGAPGATAIGRSSAPSRDGSAPPREGAAAAPGTPPRCACLAFEDEEPHHLTRWCVCGIIVGWVTMVPVLLMRPHEERPRQQLFRQHLLKPCLLIMPLWSLLWLFDSLEVLFVADILHPVYYFGISHMALPSVLVWYLFQMQAADESLVLEQRRSRAAEAPYSVGVAIEDPLPTLLKELLVTNPVVLVVLGCCAAIPILLSNAMVTLKTERGRMAQTHLTLTYLPMVLFQLGFLFVLSTVDFLDLPAFYLTGGVYLVSAPCLLTWCCCIVLMTRYGRADVDLVQRQRLQRGLEIDKGPGQAAAAREAAAGLAASEDPAENGIVDCTEAQHREYELIYTA